VSQPAFLFDLDGTLVDSEKGIVLAVNSARSEGGFQLAEPSFLRERIGLPAEHLFEDLDLESPQLTEIILKFRELLTLSINEGTKIFPGVVEFLEDSKSRGYSLSVVTNKPAELAQKLVLNSTLRDFIDLTIGVGEFPPKPKPHMLNYCMNYWKTKNARMFGDRIEDMKAATDSGIEGIGVAQGFHSETDLLNSGASKVFLNFYEIHKYFKDEGWGSK
jgi:phosphoglycolate phosphatase